MHALKNVLNRGDPYGSTAGRVVAREAGDVPDTPANWEQAAGGQFIQYEQKVFNLARNVILWWTPALVEREALRMAGDVEGPSVLSEEAYDFRAIYLQIASMIAESVPAIYGYAMNVSVSARGVVKQVEMFRDLIQEAVATLEHKAQQVAARAMDLRLRYDAQKLRAMLGALDVSPKLEKLIEAAQRDTTSREHLLQMGGEIADVLKQTARDAASIKFIADSYWDRVLDKEAEAKKVTTMVTKLGEKTGDALLKNLLSALIDAAKKQF